jgi:8-oxo-dGTP pyrophosphatase MutT (NUDIX family)
MGLFARKTLSCTSCCTAARHRRNPPLARASQSAEKGFIMAASAMHPSSSAPGLLAARIGARLLQAPPAMDNHAAPGMAAAVLVPVMARHEPVLLFTRRTEGLARHAGQISFPGGRVEPQDASALQTALRETAEETGIIPHSVSIAGYLPALRTGTGFDIQPVVGVLAPDPVLALDPAEVAAVFEAPLSFFRDPFNRRYEIRDGRHFHVFNWDGHEIWGATAAILVDLAARLGDIGL